MGQTMEEIINDPGLGKYFYKFEYDTDVPPEVYIAFRNLDKEKVKKMWTHGTNSLKLQYTLTKYNIAEIVGKPRQIFFKSTRNEDVYVLRFASGDVYVPVYLIKDEETLTEITEEILYVKVSKKGTHIYAHEIKPLAGNSKIEIGKELYEYTQKRGILPLHILILAYGYIPHKNINLYLLHRVLPLFKVAGRPIHIMHFTPPATGKTSVAIRNIYTFNWSYLNEIPSAPMLVMDAKTGSLGLVYRSNGITIDEFDKYGHEIRNIIDIVLTGMSHGKWGRAKGSKSTPDIVRFIPFCFMGNQIGIPLSPQYTRNHVQQYLVHYLKFRNQEAEAFVDRVASILLSTKHININEYLTNQVLPDSYFRGFVYVLNQEINKIYKEYNMYEGRKRLYYNQLYAILTVLGLEGEYAKELVEGVNDK